MKSNNRTRISHILCTCIVTCNREVVLHCLWRLRKSGAGCIRCEAGHNGRWSTIGNHDPSMRCWWLDLVVERRFSELARVEGRLRRWCSAPWAWLACHDKYSWTYRQKHEHKMQIHGWHTWGSQEEMHERTSAEKMASGSISKRCAKPVLKSIFRV
jgi:hypothetical protein